MGCDTAADLVGSRACSLSGLLARLPEAEREALVPVVGVALEVAEEAAGSQRLLVGAVVVLSQEHEVSVGRRTERKTTR